MTIERIAIVVAILTSVVAWWLTNYAERVLQSPTLSFDVSQLSTSSVEKCSAFSRYVLKLENISTDTRLPTFVAVIRVPGQPQAFEKVIEARCFEGVVPQGIGEMERPRLFPYAGQLELNVNQQVVAGSSFLVAFYATNPEAQRPQVTFNVDGDIRVLEQGLEAFLLKNEFEILVFLSLILLVGGGSLLVRGYYDASNS